MFEVAGNIGLTIAGISLFFAVMQLTREIRNQNMQSLFYLHQYLAQDEASAAFHHVRTELHRRPFETWDEVDMRAANKACATYDQAGLLLSTGILNRKTRAAFLSSSWGMSICDQYETLVPYLREMQTPTRSGAEFFGHFAELYAEARTQHPVRAAGRAPSRIPAL